MTRLLMATMALCGALAVGACQQTGTAAPMGAAAHQPDIGIGSPGSNAP